MDPNEWQNICEIMKHSYSTHPSKADGEKTLRRYGLLDPKPANTQLNRHCGVIIDVSRTRDFSFCKCGGCSQLPYEACAREMLCCRDLLITNGKTKWCKNISSYLEKHTDVGCIVDSLSVRKLVLDEEVLRMNIQLSNFDRNVKYNDSDLSNKNIRYNAMKAYTLLIHGQNIGQGIRIEIPTCVRLAIINAFPETNNVYGRFEGIAGEDETLGEIDDI